MGLTGIEKNVIDKIVSRYFHFYNESRVKTENQTTESSTKVYRTVGVLNVF
jgi:hypothetical protein